MPDAYGDALRIRLAADAASVPGARRFVADGLAAWGRTSLVDDATLCVSELAGNAALHAGCTFMEIGLRPLEEAVRLSVEDDGPVPVEAVVPRATLSFHEDDDESFSIDDEPTTGRGLGIVSVLASEWGVERTPAGKRVWADLAEAVEEHEVRPPRVSAADLADPPVGALPPGWALVRLVGCPVQLSLRQDAHLDELIRELQLVATDRGNARSQELAAQLAGLLVAPAHARHTGRRTAEQAAAAGLRLVDVEMALPREFSQLVRRLDAAVKAADELCERMELLTLASPPELRQLRAWMRHEIEAQVELGADPTSWEDWLRQHA